MEIIRKINYSEVLHRWAIGETKSKRFKNPNSEQNIILLKSSDPNEIIKGINAQLYPRRYLLNSLPVNTKWYLSFMPIIPEEFLKMFNIMAPGWDKLSNQTYKLIDTVDYLIKYPEKSKEISEGFKKTPNINEDFQIGITLLAKSLDGPYTIIEGNSRMVALCYHYVIKKKKCYNTNKIELVIGITDDNYRFSIIHSVM